MPTILKDKRIAKKTKFSYVHVESTERENRFYAMIDEIVHDIEWRFKQLNEYFETFYFIYDNNYLKSTSNAVVSELGTVL